jgi:hypothetical protein
VSQKKAGQGAKTPLSHSERVAVIAAHLYAMEPAIAHLMRETRTANATVKINTWRSYKPSGRRSRKSPPRFFQQPMTNNGSGLSGNGTACGQSRTKLV